MNLEEEACNGKNKWIFALIISLLFITSCGAKSGQELVAKSLDLDTSKTKEVSYFDNHDGFHGDGSAFVALECLEDGLLEEIEKDNRWKSFPIDETVKILAYGSEDGPGQASYFTDSEGKDLFPPVENGYYILLDRQGSEDGKEILKRPSLNISLGIYDIDANILYLGILDT